MLTVIVRLFDAADDTVGPLHGVVEVPGGEQRPFDDEATLVAAVLALGQRRRRDGGRGVDAPAPTPSEGVHRTPGGTHRAGGRARREPDAVP